MTGNDIKAFRERWGLTQVALAARLGVNHSTVWRWEDKQDAPVPERVAFAVRGLDITLEREQRRRPEG